MLKNKSLTFKAFILAAFTKQLIEHSKTDYVLALERTKKQSLKDKIEGSIKNSPMRKPIVLTPLIRKNQSGMQQSSQQIVPRPNMKPIQEVTPQPTTQKLQLGKINPLIQDPTVTEIECKGPEKNIIIKRMQETRQTQIILTKEEIEEIINKFSQAAKIPPQDGVIKAAVGQLIISAITSEVVEPKFIIQKIAYGMR